jgi:hypothetical protein
MFRIITKQMFFDRKPVLRQMEKKERRVLSKFGAFVRRAAKSSIRKRKRTSEPGEPPSSHTGLLKKFIFFGYDRTRSSVVIGPVRLRGVSGKDAPETLEYGGRLKSRNKFLFVTQAAGRDAGGKFVSRGKRKVKLSSKMRIAPRPFMGPAFENEKTKLPAMWRDSVR